MLLEEYTIRLILLLLPILVLVGCDRGPYQEVPVIVSNVKCEPLSRDYDCSFATKFPNGVVGLGRYRFKGFSVKDGDVLYLREKRVDGVISYHRFPNEQD